MSYVADAAATSAAASADTYIVILHVACSHTLQLSLS